MSKICSDLKKGVRVNSPLSISTKNNPFHRDAIKSVCSFQYSIFDAAVRLLSSPPVNIFSDHDFVSALYVSKELPVVLYMYFPDTKIFLREIS
jgi:hypothetical protein